MKILKHWTTKVYVDDAIDTDIATHAALDTGVHGAGGDTLATDADIDTDVATHAALLTGIHGLIPVVAASDEAVDNSTTLQNDDELLLALEANSTYIISGCLIVQSGTTPDWKASFTVPTAATIYAFFGGANDYHGQVLVSGTATVNLGGSGANVPYNVSGVVKTGGTAGNLQFQFAQNTQTLSDPATRRAASWLQIRKVV